MEIKSMNNQKTPEPPHSIEAEQQLLGALLTDNSRVDMIEGQLKAEHFYDPVHARLFEAAMTEIAAGRLASPVTLKPMFAEDDGLKELGGPKYLARLAGASVSGNAIRDYADLVVEMFWRRDLSATADTIKHALVQGRRVDEIVANIDKRMLGIPQNDNRYAVTSLSAAQKALESMMRVREGETTGGVSTGRVRLDERLGGLFNSDLIILAGRPSMGKTALATSISLSVARRQQPVCFVSTEMNDEGLMHRFFAEISGVPYFHYRTPGSLSDDELQRTADAARELADLPIDIVLDHVVDIDKVRSSCRRVQRMHGQLGLVVVDYLQLLKAEGKQRSEQIGNVSSALKRLAKELNTPVLALSQLSRSVESRDDKRPMLSDLRDSGQIEQDADVVLFVYREHYYLSRNKPTGSGEKIVEWQADCEAMKDVMEVITAKQRMGSVGADKIGVSLHVNQFWDLGEEDDDQEEMAF